MRAWKTPDSDEERVDRLKRRFPGMFDPNELFTEPSNEIDPNELGISPIEISVSPLAGDPFTDSFEADIARQQGRLPEWMDKQIERLKQDSSRATYNAAIGKWPDYSPPFNMASGSSEPDSRSALRKALSGRAERNHEQRKRGFHDRNPEGADRPCDGVDDDCGLPADLIAKCYTSNDTFAGALELCSFCYMRLTGNASGSDWRVEPEELSDPDPDELAIDALVGEIITVVESELRYSGGLSVREHEDIETRVRDTVDEWYADAPADTDTGGRRR